MRLVAQVFANALSRKRDEEALRASEERLQQTLDEVQRLCDRLLVENVYLREQLQRDGADERIVGESGAVLKMLAQAKRVAPTDTTVLITGETGTGKELLARAIHDMSGRSAKPMVTVNWAALPPALIESELFGREKGAYTGAMTRQAGRFELADGSSLFLDEIGDLPLDVQVKLLRGLQDWEFERLGSTHTLTADVRVIAATNRDLFTAAFDNTVYGYTTVEVQGRQLTLRHTAADGRRVDSLVLSKPLAAADPVAVLAARAPGEAPRVRASFHVDRPWLAEAVTLRLLGEGTVSALLNGAPVGRAGGRRGDGGFAAFDVDPGRLAAGRNRLELESRAAPGRVPRAPLAEVVVLERAAP